MSPLWVPLKTPKTSSTRSCTEKSVKSLKAGISLATSTGLDLTGKMNENRALLHAQSVHNQHLIWRQTANHVSWKHPGPQRPWYQLDLSSNHPTTQPNQRSLHLQLPKRRLRSAIVIMAWCATKETPCINTKHSRDFWLRASAQIPQRGRESPRVPPGSGCYLQMELHEGGHSLFSHCPISLKKNHVCQPNPR